MPPCDTHTHSRVHSRAHLNASARYGASATAGTARPFERISVCGTAPLRPPGTAPLRPPGTAPLRPPRKVMRTRASAQEGPSPLTQSGSIACSSTDCISTHPIRLHCMLGSAPEECVPSSSSSSSHPHPHRSPSRLTKGCGHALLRAWLTSPCSLPQPSCHVHAGRRGTRARAKRRGGSVSAGLAIHTPIMALRQRWAAR